MKRSLTAIMLLWPLYIFGKPVNQQYALQVAENFINMSQIGANGVLCAPAKPIRLAKNAKQVTKNQQFYIFQNTDGDGYVIVSADDIARPVLGFSDKGNVENMPDNMRWWLSEYDREIQWAIAQNLEPDEETLTEWQDLYQAPQAKQADVIVAPLIKTEWSQGTWFNSKCPYDEQAGAYCKTGCVATAMAQIMKYWKFPQNGRGNHTYTHPTYGKLSADFENTTYNWDNMPNDLSIFSSSTQMNAIATLMYHCGVSVDMDYGKNESGAVSFLVPYAMRNYFWYSDEATYLSKDDYTLYEWQNKVQWELYRGRPVFYTGGNMLSGGSHAFICDGLRSDNYFHFNWGWDECNGYYSMSSLKPTTFFISNGDYTSNQHAVFYLYPKSDTISRYILEMGDELYLPDSIPYGTSWDFKTHIRNVGFKAFSGYIYAVVKDQNLENILCIDSLYYDSNNLWDDVPYFHMDSASKIPIGKYYLFIQYKDSLNGELKRVRGDYYSAHKAITVYPPLERADGYIFPHGWYYPHIYLTEDTLVISTVIRNTGRLPIGGEIALQFVNASDSTINQYFDIQSMAVDPIEAYGKQDITFKGLLNIPEGSYLVYLLYRVNKDVDWALIEEADIFYNPEEYIVLSPESQQEYYIAAKRTSGNYYFLTPNKVSGKNRLVAVDAGTSVRTSIDTINTTPEYLWTFVDNKLKNHNGQYLSCSAAKSVVMANTGIELIKTANLDGSVTFSHAASETETWYFSLALAGNDYFVFYANANQFTHLLMLPKGKGTTTRITDINVIPETQKIRRNGQIYILRDGKAYTVTGAEVK